MKIVPPGIVFLDQANLPHSVPALQLFLSRDGIADISECLEINQQNHAMLLRESWNAAFLVFRNAADKIIGHADIECAVAGAGEDIDEIFVQYRSGSSHLGPLPSARDFIAGFAGDDNRG